MLCLASRAFAFTPIPSFRIAITQPTSQHDQIDSRYFPVFLRFPVHLNQLYLAFAAGHVRVKSSSSEHPQPAFFSTNYGVAYFVVYLAFGCGEQRYKT